MPDIILWISGTFLKQRVPFQILFIGLTSPFTAKHLRNFSFLVWYKENGAQGAYEVLFRNNN